jgi:hypothetical protein
MQGNPRQSNHNLEAEATQVPLDGATPRVPEQREPNSRTPGLQDPLAVNTMPESYNEVLRIVVFNIEFIIVEAKPSSQVVLDFRNRDRRPGSTYCRRESALQSVLHGLDVEGARHDDKRTERPILLRGAQHGPLPLDVRLRVRGVEDGIRRPLLPRWRRRGRRRRGLRRRGRML